MFSTGSITTQYSKDEFKQLFICDVVSGSRSVVSGSGLRTGTLQKPHPALWPQLALGGLIQYKTHFDVILRLILEFMVELIQGDFMV